MRNLAYFFGLIALLLSACSRKAARWDNNVALPLFSTEMTLNDIDRRFLVNNASDSSYTLVYDNLVYNARTLRVTAPDTSLNTFFTLRRLKLSDRSIVQRITLAQINPTFRLLDGQTIAVPAQNQSDLSPVDIDASAFFETATLDSGFLDISISNELPVRVSLLVFELQNASDGSVVAKDSFLNIDQGSSAKKSINLRNKTVGKNLKGVIRRLITDASNGAVLINASKGVEITLTVRDLRPRNAIAAFPNQTVIEQDQSLVLDMGGPQIKFFKVKQGSLRLKVETTIQENMTMILKIPSASYNGVPLERVVKMPGAKPGSVERQEETVDMSGYLIDYRGKDPAVKDTVNTFHQVLLVTLDSSGRKVQVTLSDSLRISYSLTGLLPEYATGYMGQTLNSSSGKAPFALFKGADGNILFKDFKASVLVKNTIGAEGSVRVKSLESENIFSGNKVKLGATPLNSKVFIGPAPFVYGQSTDKQVLLDGGNSNIKAFVENLPQWINYDIDIETNPNGNVSNWKDFVFDNSGAEIYLRLEAPASFTIGGLNLRDTQGIEAASIPQVQRVKSATVIFDIENDYPFEVGMNFTLLDEYFNPLGEVSVSPGSVLPGKTGPGGEPLAPSRTILRANIPKDRIEALHKAHHVAMKARVVGNGTQQKIYNTYKLKVKTSLQAEYEAQF